MPRDELFITTKLTNSEQGYDTTLAAFDGSMKKLGIDVLDLFLIHWPLPMFDQYVETWRAFERLLADGRVRSIGVSNFEIPHLQRLLAETDVKPTVNQVELHPEFPQEELRLSTTSMESSPSRGAARSGQGTAGEPRHRRGGATQEPHAGAGRAALACAARLVVIPKSVHPERCGRTSNCLISNSMMPTWPTSQEFGPASVSAATRTCSRCASC